MKRLLIAIDDYSELISTENILRKLGFDVIGIQNDVAISEKMMSFQPECILLSAYGQRVQGLKFLPKIKKKNNLPKIILIQQRSRPAMGAEIKMADAVVDSPVQAPVLIELLSEFFGLDSESLLQKYEKSSDLKKEKPNVVHVKGGEAQKPTNEMVGQAAAEKAMQAIQDYKVQNSLDPAREEMRSEKYREIAQSQPLPPFRGFPRGMVSDQVKDFRSREDDPEVQSIDQERRAYVKALLRRIRH